MANSTSTKTKKPTRKELEKTIESLRSTNKILLGVFVIVILAYLSFSYMLWSIDTDLRKSLIADLDNCECNLDNRIEGLRYTSTMMAMCEYTIRFVDREFNLTEQIMSMDNDTLSELTDEYERIGKIYQEAEYERIEDCWS